MKQDRMERVESYTQQLPEETRLIVAALDNPIRQAIVVLLTERAEMPFSEMQKELATEKLTLNFHLKKLFASALIDHYYKHELGNQKYSFYALTPLAKRVVASLNAALIPPPPNQASASQVIQPRPRRKHTP